MTDLLKPNDSVSSVIKVFSILQAISDEPEIGITELSERILMPKSTLYRFLQTMKVMGYIAQEDDRDKYSLTLKLFELGAKALEHTDLIKNANAKMLSLSTFTKETTHLGILDKDSIVYIHKIDSSYALRMYSRIGRRNPLYSTAIGKVLLAWLDESKVREILKEVEFIQHTDKTLLNIDALLLELSAVREQGYSMDNEEMEAGLLCTAVPVYDRFGTIIAGLSMSYPTTRITPEKQQEYIQLLHQCAAEISATIGFSEYPQF